MTEPTPVSGTGRAPELALERALGLLFLGFGGLAASVSYFPAREWFIHRELGEVALTALSLAVLSIAAGSWLWSHGRRLDASPLPTPARVSIVTLLVLYTVALQVGFAWIDAGRVTWRDLGGSLGIPSLFVLALLRTRRRSPDRPTAPSSRTSP